MQKPCCWISWIFWNNWIGWILPSPELPEYPVDCRLSGKAFYCASVVVKFHTTIVRVLVFSQRFLSLLVSSNVTRPASYRLLSPLVSRLASRVILPPWGEMASPLRSLTQDASKRHKTTRQRDPIDYLVAAKGRSRFVRGSQSKLLSWKNHLRLSYSIICYSKVIHVKPTT